jgi:hypothetical protein
VIDWVMEATVHDVRERVRRELERLEPSPDGLEKTLRRVRRRDRNRRAGAGAVALLLLPGLVLGLWLSLRSQQPAPRGSPSAAPDAISGQPRLFLAGDDELWVVEVATGSVHHLELPQLSPGDPPYRILRRGDKLVAWGSDKTYLLDLVTEPTPRVLVNDSWVFIPAASPDRIWVGVVDPKRPATDRRIAAVREVAVDGRVTVADVRPPQGRLPVAATLSGLVFQRPDGQMEVWNPQTGDVVRRLPGEFPVASHANLLAWCRQDCARLHLTDVVTGEDVEVRPPAGTFGFEGYRGAFSPDGKLIAVPVRSDPSPTTPDPEWRLAVVDVAAGTATLVKGASAHGYVFVDWSPSGTTVFMTGGERFGERTILAYRLGAAGATRLPVRVGDFYGMAAA